MSNTNEIPNEPVSFIHINNPLIAWNGREARKLLKEYNCAYWVRACGTRITILRGRRRRTVDLLPGALNRGRRASEHVL